MTTLNFPVVPPAPTPVQRSSVTISDATFRSLGITTEPQKLVYRAIKSSSLKHERSIANATGLDELTATKALQDLVHLNLLRRGAAPFGGLAAFEVIERR